MKEIHLLTLQLKKGIRRFSTIVNHLKDKNPAMNDGQTLIHIAAQEGQLEIVKYIVDDLEGINPADKEGYLPLYMAAHEGHLEIVKYISQFISNSCHEQGHLGIVEYIARDLEANNPSDKHGKTPHCNREKRLIIVFQ